MRRAIRISGWVLGGVLTIVALLVTAVLIAGNTAGGRILIERSVARLSAGHVRLSGLAGGFPAAIDIQHLRLSDEHGVWLSADRLSLRWSPLGLLVRHVNVERLQIARLAIERRPVTETSQAGSTRMPHTDISQLSIGTLELGPQLAGMRALLSIEGSAHLVSLEDATASLIARQTNGAGDYEIRLRCDPSEVVANLTLEEPAGGTLANLLQLPGLGALSVEASLTGPRNAERLEATVRAGELRALAHGSLDLTRGNADLVYRAEAPAMAPRPDLAWQRIALQGRWQGTIKTPRAAARLRIDGLQLPGGSGLGALDSNLSADRGELSVQAFAEGLRLPGREPGLLADSPLHVSTTMRLNEEARPLQLLVEHHLFSLQAQAVTGGALSATFSLRLPQLGPFGALMGQPIRGRAELKGALKQSSGTTHLDVDAHTAVAEGATLLAALLAGTSHVQFAASLTEQALEVERLSLNGPKLSASASGGARRGTKSDAPAIESLRARYEASLADLAVLSPTLRGTLKVTGQLEGPVTAFASRLHVASSVSVRGAPEETIAASIRAVGLPSLASATLEAEGHLLGAPLQVDASLGRRPDAAFHLAVRRADWKSAHLEGDMTTGARGVPGSGSLRLRMERLEELQPLMGTSLKGSIAASLALRPVAGRTDVQLQLDAKNIIAAQVPASARLTAGGPLDALALQVNVQSPSLQGSPGRLDAGARLNLSAHELRLEHAEAHFRGQALRLLAPARVAFGEGVAISGLRMGIQNAVIELDGRVSPALELHAAARRIDADLINSFVPDLLAQGTFDLDARLAGTTAAPSGLVTLTVARLRPNAARDLQAVDVNATARLMGQAARLDAHLKTGRDSQLALTGTMPLNVQGALDLRLNGKLDAELGNPWLEARGERLSGALTINATVTGAARSPKVGGTLDLANGDLRDYVQGVHLSSIGAHITGSGGILRIERLTARAGTGELALTGQIGVLQSNLPLSLHLIAKRAEPITSDVLTANVDGDLKAEGTLRERIDLSGTINVNHAVIGIPNALPPEVAVLDVRRPGQAPPAPPERKIVIGLDLKLHAPREILVQGRGLDAELGGNLHIRGTTTSPTVSGAFEMIRGTFTLASTKLDFKEGRVSFNGAGLSGKIDPTLDFTAQATASDATATLHVTGLADSPQFKLTSSPSMPQDEILARLLFGESASQLTPLQIAQTAAALATLSGVGGSGPNPLARVQKALGLDRLSVGGGGSTGAPGAQSSGASVQAGRYVSSRVYVGAKQSTTGFSQVEVDVDLSKRLKLQTRLGNGTTTAQGTTPENDPGSSVGMVYQFEY